MKTCTSTALPYGKESFFNEFNTGNLNTADDLLNDLWSCRGRSPLHLPLPLSWTEDPYGDSYWRFVFHSLRHTPHLLWAYRTTGKKAYLDRLLEILESYVCCDKTRSFDGKRFDNKHASAFRAMVIVNTYRKCESWGVLPSQLAINLRATLSRLGTFLFNPKNYEGKFNHGFNQAAALLLLADNFPELDTKGDWRLIAIQRLESLIDANVDADGVNVENSPFYHFYVLGIITQIAVWLEQWEPELAPLYLRTSHRMAHYAAMIVQPNGRLPMLGATASTKVSLSIFERLTEVNRHFHWVHSRGVQGEPPPAGVALFPNAGHFLLRSETPPSGELDRQTFITFDSGPYRTAHSDLDALSITYYAEGVSLLPDSGLFTYDKGIDRDYFHGTRSHNTVVVDGQDQIPGAAVPVCHGNVQGVSWATGTSKLVKGVMHRRSVILLDANLAVVCDTLTSSEAHSYAQTWHLFPEAELEMQGSLAIAKDKSSTVRLLLRQVNYRSMTSESWFGAKSPMRGWHSVQYGKKKANWTIEYTQRATSACFITLIASGAHAASRPWIGHGLTGQHRQMIWVCTNNTQYYLTLVDQGKQSERLAVRKVPFRAATQGTTS